MLRVLEVAVCTFVSQRGRFSRATEVCLCQRFSLLVMTFEAFVKFIHWLDIVEMQKFCTHAGFLLNLSTDSPWIESKQFRKLLMVFMTVMLLLAQLECCQGNCLSIVRWKDKGMKKIFFVLEAWGMRQQLPWESPHRGKGDRYILNSCIL